MRFCVQHFKASLMAKTKGYLRLCKQQPLAYKPAFPEMIQQMVPTCRGGVKPLVPWQSFTIPLPALFWVVLDSDILHSLATRKTCNKGLGVSQISWRRFVLNPKNCQARQVELPCDPMMWGTWSRDVEEWSPWIGSFFLGGVWGEIWEKHSNHHFLRVKRHLGRRNSKTLHVGRKPATVPSVVDRRSFFHAVFLGALAYLNLFDAYMQPMYYGSCELLSCK